MTDYVFVHGAFGSAWSWHKIVPLLEAKGHRAHALNLPGPENDGTPVPEVTLDLYAKVIAGFIEKLGKKVVLVGHSMGGLAISAAGERLPDKIGALVYVTALLVKNGQRGFDIPLGGASSAPSGFDPSLGYVTMQKEGARELFYNCCSEQDVVEAIANRRDHQALAPLVTPLSITAERFGRIPRHYVECLQDRAIAIATQRAMHEAQPCKSVLTLDADHAPFLCRPVELANYLSGLHA